MISHLHASIIVCIVMVNFRGQQKSVSMYSCTHTLRHADSNNKLAIHAESKREAFHVRHRMKMQIMTSLKGQTWTNISKFAPEMLCNRPFEDIGIELSQQRLNPGRDNDVWRLNLDFQLIMRLISTHELPHYLTPFRHVHKMFAVVIFPGLLDKTGASIKKWCCFFSSADKFEALTWWMSL